MKRSFKVCVWFTLIILLWGSSAACSSSAEAKKLYYAMEKDGEVFGYIETNIIHIEKNGKPLIQLKETIKTMSSLMGAQINNVIKSETLVDPEKKRLISQEFMLDQGSTQLNISTIIEGNKARITQNMGGGEKEINLPPDAILIDYYLYHKLWEDFAKSGLDKKQYKILDLFDREIHLHTFTKTKEEKIELAGNIYNSIAFDVLNHEIGAKQHLWIDAENGFLLKQEILNSTVLLSDKSVKYKLKRASLDDNIFTKVGVSISDIMAISYLKVKASLNPIGNWITPDSLNVPGQSFKGTVENNHIQGTFEISHKKYDGNNPPSFPPDFPDTPELAAFLNPEDLIESADPVLVKKAKDLTKGAADGWEASKRLSKWVAEEIGYDIPGGGSARNTYDLKAGECGAHSRLFTALCRAVGIPSRVVWGCIYVPTNGGSFGQHGWNEVYMGEAGWIPLDTTAREIDFADSGHIRLGILSSKHIAYNPDKIEILDFHSGSQRFGEAKSLVIPEKYKPYLGKFQGPKRVLKILVQNNSLAIDIPGQMVFEFTDPDENGLWYFKLTRDVNVSFQKDSSGKTIGMTISDKTRIPKKPQTQEIKDNVPEKFRSYLGKYPIPMQEGEFTVNFRGNNLSIKVPTGEIMDLEGPDEQGIWKHEHRKDKFSFVLDDDGNVKMLVIHIRIYAPKID